MTLYYRPLPGSPLLTAPPQNGLAASMSCCCQTGPPMECFDCIQAAAAPRAWALTFSGMINGLGALGIPPAPCNCNLLNATFETRIDIGQPGGQCFCVAGNSFQCYCGAYLIPGGQMCPLTPNIGPTICGTNIHVTGPHIIRINFPAQIVWITAEIRLGIEFLGGVLSNLWQFQLQLPEGITKFDCTQTYTLPPSTRNVIERDLCQMGPNAQCVAVPIP